MQQPDYRNQSEPEVQDETEENSQSIRNEMQNQETSQMEQEEKKTDCETVSSIFNIMKSTNLKMRPEFFSASAISWLTASTSIF